MKSLRTCSSRAFRIALVEVSPIAGRGALLCAGCAKRSPTLDLPCALLYPTPARTHHRGLWGWDGGRGGESRGGVGLPVSEWEVGPSRVRHARPPAGAEASRSRAEHSGEITVRRSVWGGCFTERRECVEGGTRRHAWISPRPDRACVLLQLFPGAPRAPPLCADQSPARKAGGRATGVIGATERDPVQAVERLGAKASRRYDP